MSQTSIEQIAFDRQQKAILMGAKVWFVLPAPQHPYASVFDNMFQELPDLTQAGDDIQTLESNELFIPV